MMPLGVVVPGDGALAGELIGFTGVLTGDVGRCRRVGSAGCAVG